ncbi:hypothetical protein [Mammaliicoccus sciuri]|uniref:hypothetical protein n=1 Tax=Mammaliicoccus sciuri TaxID=1296 RepID=UPI00132FE46C|nr:hypothetical protein [Mammaliicoccus sciuri]
MEVSKAQAELLMVDGLLNELDQYKTAHDKLTAGLKEAVAESIKYKRERDSLIKDVEKLRGALIKTQNLADELMDIQVKYNNLTEHIRLKALHNPSVSRYKDLMHYIDELEGGFND